MKREIYTRILDCNIKTYKNHTNNTFTPIVYNGAKEFTIDAFSDMSKHI